MELNDIIEYIADPNKALSVQDFEEIIDWTTFFIYEFEQDISSMDFILDTMLADLIEKHGSVAKAEVHLRLTEEWKDRKKKDLTLKALKSYRQNIRKKRDRMYG